MSASLRHGVLLCADYISRSPKSVSYDLETPYHLRPICLTCHRMICVLFLLWFAIVGLHGPRPPPLAPPPPLPPSPPPDQKSLFGKGVRT